MQSFAEFVAENYYSTVDLTWDYVRAGLVTAYFLVDETRVSVRFENDETVWRVAFEVDRGDKTDVANSAFDIFNGVFAAVQEFLEVRQPEVLVFATKKDKLARIYQLYLRRAADTIRAAGYELEDIQSVEPFTEFTLRRVKPSGWKS